jgi:hypothetical protein
LKHESVKIIDAALMHDLTIVKGVKEDDKESDPLASGSLSQPPTGVGPVKSRRPHSSVLDSHEVVALDHKIQECCSKQVGRLLDSSAAPHRSGDRAFDNAVLSVSGSECGCVVTR